MGIESIVEKIQSLSKKDSEKVLEEARAKASETLANFEEDARAEMEKAEAEMEDRLQLKLERNLAEVRSGLRLRWLAEREHLLEKVRKEAIEKVLHLKPDALGEILQQLFQRAANEVPSGTVRVPPEATQFLNSEGGMKVIPDTEIPMGLLVSSPGGDMDLDLTFTTLEQALWHNARHTISRVLLGDENGADR